MTGYKKQDPINPELITDLAGFVSDLSDTLHKLHPSLIRGGGGAAGGPGDMPGQPGFPPPEPYNFCSHLAGNPVCPYCGRQVF
jgi:hypothetical protein